MKMYKCPTCGKTYTSMYCDYCGKSIPSSCTTYGSMDGDNAVSGEDATNEMLNKIARYEESNNRLLEKIAKSTTFIAWVVFVNVLASLALTLYYIFAF